MASVYLSCLVFIFIIHVGCCKEQYCYKTDSDPLRRYGTKTAYRDRIQIAGSGDSEHENTYKGLYLISYIIRTLMTVQTRQKYSEKY